MRRFWMTAVLAGVCATAACGTPAPTAPAAPSGTRTGAPATSGGAATLGGRAVPAGTTPPGVTLSKVQTADGSIVTVAAFHGPVQYALHNGSQDPGSAYARFVHAGPALSPAERPRLELDINPQWVQLDTAPAAGGLLTAAIPRQVRPPNQYLVGWTRDFIAVLAPAAGTPARAASHRSP